MNHRYYNIKLHKRKYARRFCLQYGKSTRQNKEDALFIRRKKARPLWYCSRLYYRIFLSFCRCSSAWAVSAALGSVCFFGAGLGFSTVFSGFS